jgi:hypothetical protein
MKNKYKRGFFRQYREKLYGEENIRSRFAFTDIPAVIAESIAVAAIITLIAVGILSLIYPGDIFTALKNIISDMRSAAGL